MAKKNHTTQDPSDNVFLDDQKHYQFTYSLFVYGTLRPDLPTSLRPTYWHSLHQIPLAQKAKHQHGFIENAKLFSNIQNTYPYLTFEEDLCTKVYGVNLEFRTKQDFREILAITDKIEEYDPDAQDSYYFRTTVEFFPSASDSSPCKTWVYFIPQSRSKGLLSIKEGDWITFKNTSQ